MLVAAAAVAAVRDDDACAGMREIGDEPLLLVEHLRADGHLEHGILPALAAGEPAAAAAAAGRLDPLIGAEAGEIAPLRIRHQHDVAPRPAVATVRPTLRHELLAPKVNRTVTATACLDKEFGAIVEHGQNCKAQTTRAAQAQS